MSHRIPEPHRYCPCRNTHTISDPDNIPLAIDHIEKVFHDAIVSGRHKPRDWRNSKNKDRLIQHMHDYLLNRTNDNEDHLANLICRALMLLQLRLEKDGDSK